MDQVSIVRCESYEEDCIQAAVDRAMELIGGLAAFVQPGMRVALKVNLLKKNRPEDCVTTHPAVVAAVARRVRELGATPVIGDSPGGPYTEGALRAIYRTTGMEEAARASGAELNTDVGTESVPFEKGVAVRMLELTRFVTKADLVIDLCKCKTHGMTRYTGAVKNLFGAVPGLRKVEYHCNFPKLEKFSELLVDVCACVAPSLCLMDAVWGMEGDGPSAGKPRKFGAILCSQSPYALDVCAAGMMLENPFEICTVARATERGLGPSCWEEIQCLGDDYASFLQRDCMVPEGQDANVLKGKLPSALSQSLSRRLRPKPVFDRKLCVGCQICKNSCPPGAITMQQSFPKVDLHKCIRCFCCHELCPQKAVSIKRNALIRWLH